MHVHSVANVTVDRSLRSVAAQDWHFPLFLAHGVTGVRNMNDGTGDVTLELTKSVRRRLAEGDLRGPPRFLTAGPSLDGDPPLGSNPVVVRTAAEARAAVEQLVSNGADLVKVYENLSREAYFAIMDEARRRRIPVDGHVPFRVTPEEVADAGQRTVEHPDALAAGCSTAAEAERKRFASVLADYDSLPDGEKFLAMFRHARALYDSRDPVACASAIEAYRRNGVAVTVDLVAYHHVVYAKQVLSDAARMRLVPQQIRRNWENWLDSETTREFQSILRPIVPLELENVRLLNEAGVLLLAATDVGVPLQVPGISLHVELERLVEAGLTPLEALQTATLNPARVLEDGRFLGQHRARQARRSGPARRQPPRGHPQHAEDPRSHRRRPALSPGRSRPASCWSNEHETQRLPETASHRSRDPLGSRTACVRLRQETSGAKREAIALLSLGGIDDRIEIWSALFMLRNQALNRQLRRYDKIRGGNDLLPKAFAERLADKIHYASPVVRIEQDTHGVKAVFLQVDSYQTWQADHLICAVPFTVQRDIEVSPAFSVRSGARSAVALSLGLQDFSAVEAAVLDRQGSQRLRRHRPAHWAGMGRDYRNPICGASCRRFR